MYDGMSRLRVRSEYTWMVGTGWYPGPVTRYIYDGMRVVQERTGATTPSVAYTRGKDLSGSLEGAGGIGGFLARSHGYSAGNWSTHNFYHADALGNVTYMMSSAQAMVASYKYDPYGRTISSSGTLASANLYRFSSKEVSAVSGMYYYGYRFYDPKLQRWLNRDPLREAGGENLYRFAGGNPLSLIDPFGLKYGNPYPPVIIIPIFNPKAVPREPDATVSEEFWNELTDPDGYTACYAHCMLGLPTAGDFANELGAGKGLGRQYYYDKYPTWFKAKGRHSKVMVPRFASRISLALLPITACDIIHCLEKCLDETSDVHEPYQELAPPYSGGPVNTPPVIQF